MKKQKITSLITLIIALVVCFTLVGCSCNNGQSNVTMTDSYSKARNEFKAVTGVELPMLENLEVEEYPYEEGDKSYCFDITGGTNISMETFNSIKTYLDSVLSDWEKTGPEVQGEYTNYNYNSNSGWIGLTYDSTNVAIYINANMN